MNKIIVTQLITVTTIWLATLIGLVTMGVAPDTAQSIAPVTALPAILIGSELGWWLEFNESYYFTARVF